MTEELKIIISAEIGKLKDELKKGQKELKETEKVGKSAGSGLGKALAAAGKAVGVAVGIMVAAVSAAGAAIFGLSEKTRECRTQQALLSTAFITAGSTAEVAKETYGDLYRVLGDSGQATEASQQLAMLTNDAESLSEWTNICQGVYATFGESLPIESLAEAANETAKTGELTGALADALNWAGVNEDEFADKLFLCNTEAEREALIRETLTGLYGEAASEYEKTAGAIMDAHEAQMLLDNAMAELGGILEPVVTLLKGGLAQALTDILPHITLMAEGITDIANGVEGGGEKIKTGIQNIVDAASAFLSENIGDFATIGTDLVIALATGIVAALPQIISALAAALPTLVGGILDAALSLTTTLVDILDDILLPIVNAIPGLLIAICDAVAKALPLLITTIIQVVINIVQALPDILKILLAAIPEAVVALIGGIMEAFPLLITGLLDLVLAIVEAIPQLLTAIIEAIPRIIDMVIGGLLEALPQILEGLIQLVIGIVDALPAITNAIVEAIPYLIETLLATVLNCLPQIIGTLIILVARLVVAIPQILLALIEAVIGIVVGLFTTIVDTFKNLPSILGNIFGSAADGVKKAWSNVGSFFKGVVSNVKSAFGGIADWFGNTFSGAWTKVKNVFSTGGKIFSGIKDGILSGLKTVINGLITGINKVITVPFNGINSALQKIKGISIAGLKPFSWMPSISVPQIPKLYRGGVLERGQVGLLEGSGAEAVVPLENNDAWLTKIAEKLHGLMGDESGRDIILQVDGKTFARTSIKSINQLTKQTGKLDLILA